jgi:apolipoprotein N-acyltransferase
LLELKNKLKLISLAFIFGCTYSLAFKNITPLALFPLSIVSIYFWYRWIQKIQFKKDLFLFHFFFGLGVSLCSFYWVAHTVRTFGNLTYPLSYLVNFSFGLITCPYLWVGLIWIKWRQK